MTFCGTIHKHNIHVLKLVQLELGQHTLESTIYAPKLHSFLSFLKANEIEID